MKIIVDMMGGDNAPLAVLEGAAQAVKEYGVQLIGVGNEALVRKTAAEHNIPLDGIELVNCTETIEMCDEPARAIRQKKDSSIVVGLNLLKEGKGDALFLPAAPVRCTLAQASSCALCGALSARHWLPWCPQSSRRICCWTAVPTWSAARRCWPPLRSWAAAM